MLDNTARWGVPPDPASPVLDTPALRVAPVQLGCQLLLSGDLGRALEALDAPPPIGWPDLAAGERYGLRLRRDRALLVGVEGAADGWTDAGYALTEMSDAYAVFEASGPDLPAFLARGSEMFIDEPSASVARLFGGFAALIYRHARPDCVRIHVEAPLAAAFRHWCVATQAEGA